MKPSHPNIDHTWYYFIREAWQVFFVEVILPLNQNIQYHLCENYIVKDRIKVKVGNSSKMSGKYYFYIANYS